MLTIHLLAERRPSHRESVLPPPPNVETEQHFMTPHQQQHRNSLPYYSQHMAHDYQDLTGQKRKYSLVDGALERQSRQAERQMSWSPSMYRARTPSIDHMSHSLPTSYGIPIVAQGSFGRQTSPHMSDSMAAADTALPNDTAQLAPIQHSFRPPFGQPMDSSHHMDSSNNPMTSGGSSNMNAAVAPTNNFSYTYMQVSDRRIDEAPLMPPIGRSGGGGMSGGLRNNSPQELFSSQSFHAVNQSTMQVRNDSYVTTNSFMSQPALVAGNWSEYELQM